MIVTPSDEKKRNLLKGLPPNYISPPFLLHVIFNYCFYAFLLKDYVRVCMSCCSAGEGVWKGVALIYCKLWLYYFNGLGTSSNDGTAVFLILQWDLKNLEMYPNFHQHPTSLS